MARRLLRDLVGSVAVLVTIGMVAVGLPALDRAVPSGRTLAAAQRYQVGGGVSVTPPAGARVDVSKTRPAGDRGTVLFLVGATRYVIVVAPYRGDTAGAAARLRAKIESRAGHQVTAEEDEVNTATGLHGRAGGYSAPGRVGGYAVFVIGAVAIEVTFSGTDGELGAVMEQIRASIDSITWRTGR